MKEPWIVFYGPDQRELAAYTQRGTFPGELKATREMLAAENDLAPEEIRALLVNR